MLREEKRSVEGVTASPGSGFPEPGLVFRGLRPYRMNRFDATCQPAKARNAAEGHSLMSSTVCKQGGLLGMIGQFGQNTVPYERKDRNTGVKTANFAPV